MAGPTGRSLTLLLVLALAGCGVRDRAAAPVGERDGHVITAEQIERSGARDAWEALARNGAPLSMAEDSRGNQRVRQRGNSSINLNNAPLLVVDEVPMADLRYLREIRAAAIESIRVLTGTRGTALYGSTGGNGVIVIVTRTGH